MPNSRGLCFAAAVGIAYFATLLAVIDALVRISAKRATPAAPRPNSDAQWWATFWTRYNFVGESAALQPDPVVARYWRHLCPREDNNATAPSVLVPLCGTGDDLELLAEVCRARIVVGNEIDETPIAVFFRRLLGSRHPAPALLAGATALPYFAQPPAPSLPAGVIARDGSAGKWFGVTTTADTTIGILQADFLALDPDSLRADLPSAVPFDAVLDVRAFIAVRPGPQRTRYAYQLRRLVRPGSRLLIVLLLPFGVDQQGVRLPRSTPPYVVTDQEIHQLFRPFWQMQPVGLPVMGRHGQEQAFIAVRNSVPAALGEADALLPLHPRPSVA